MRAASMRQDRQSVLRSALWLLRDAAVVGGDGTRAIDAMRVPVEVPAPLLVVAHRLRARQKQKVAVLPARFVAMKEALPPGARLIINQIEMDNFKSYAGSKTVGPFHKSFSAVVGPNGSGKSNVIDALQFVFGKRAAKIRFKKLADLIHNSTSFPNRPKARVTVSFSYIVDAPDGTFTTVPDASFTVERTVLRSGVCDYFLDDARSNWAEVTCVLKAQGIDLDHNRFLILQGEVELISQMKPKGTAAGEEGLLEYLEDIIGSNAFVEPIAAASRDLEAAAGEHDAALGRANFAVHERDKLAGLKDEAVAHFAALMELCDKRALLVRLDQLEATQRAAEMLATQVSECVCVSVCLCVNIVNASERRVTDGPFADHIDRARYRGCCCAGHARGFIGGVARRCGS